MKRICTLALACMACALCNTFAAAEEFQFDRDWIGRLRVAGGIGSGINWHNLVSSPVAATLSGRLDDVSDTFTLDSLVYEDGSRDFYRNSRSSETFVTLPTDFPNNESIQSTLLQSLTLTHYEWINAPQYVDVPPAALKFAGGDVWRTAAIPDAPLEPILVRVIGEYVLSLDGDSKTTPVDVTLRVDPYWAEFSFATGNNYPESLFFRGAMNSSNTAIATVSASIGPHTRTASIGAYFLHVPEPASGALLIVATSASLACLRRCRRAVV